MLGLRVFIHALKQVFWNFRAAVQISGLICALQFGYLYFVFGALNVEFNFPLSQRYLLSVVTLMIIWVGGFIWMAVAWHRYVLLNERPNSIVPQLRIKNMGAYFMRGLRVGLVCIIVSLVIGVIGFLINAILAAVFLGGMTGKLYIWMLIPPVLNLTVSMFFFTLSPVLVAGALGTAMSFSEAQSAFSGKLSNLFVLALVAAIVSWGSGEIVRGVVTPMAGVPVVSLIVELIYYWVSSMVGISILTTIYGHFIEKRELV